MGAEAAVKRDEPGNAGLSVVHVPPVERRRRAVIACVVPRVLGPASRYHDWLLARDGVRAALIEQETKLQQPCVIKNQTTTKGGVRAMEPPIAEDTQTYTDAVGQMGHATRSRTRQRKENTVARGRHRHQTWEL